MVDVFVWGTARVICRVPRLVAWLMCRVVRAWDYASATDECLCDLASCRWCS